VTFARIADAPFGYRLLPVGYFSQSRDYSARMIPLALPPDYPRIKRVKSFAELLGPPFADGVNALCWERPLPGDPGEIIAQLGPASEGLRNDQAQRRVDAPETRAALLRDFGGEDNDAFREHLNEQCYDLHYAPAPHARPFSFGPGNLWRIAVAWPGSPAPPCIHCAPRHRPR
jgi:hypothetical protein